MDTELQRFRQEAARLGISTASVTLSLIRNLDKKTDTEKQIVLIRNAAQTLLALNPDSLHGFCNISIHQKVSARPPEEDCFRYLFGMRVSQEQGQQIVEELTASPSFEVPVPNAYAIYFDANNIPRHIGRVTRRRSVLSKWGTEGHVYEHPPLYVPSSYGKTLKYYMKRK